MMIGMAYSPDGKWLSVIAEDGMVRLFDPIDERYVIPISRSTRV